MFKKNRGFTTSQSKLTSRRMRSAMVGTHVPKRPRSSSRHMNADAVGFSNSRKNKRAARGVVDTIVPSTGSRESSSDHLKRVGRREFTQEIQHKARIRRTVIIVIAALVVVAVAIGVGIATFLGSLDSKMTLGSSSDAKSALVAPKEAAPWYALVTADLGSASAAQDESGPDVLLLARVDEASRAVTLISLPPHLQVTLKDGKVHKLREAADQGDAALISAVAAFADVSVSHYVKTDEKGIASLVDKLGGIEVSLDQEVDDPTAGDTYLAVGDQVLNGEAAITYLRAQNFKEGLDDQTKNQREFFSTIALRMLESRGAFSFATLLDSVGDTFKTDENVSGILRLSESLQGIDVSAIQGAQVPGYEVVREDVRYYVSSGDAWKNMMTQVAAGQPPIVEDSSTELVDRANTKVEVRNGAGITSGASQIGELLRAGGFAVEKVGNAESDAFPETLIIYDGEERKAQAESVAAELGSGRVIVGAGFYTYEDVDVLVILGKDWKPVA